jgi:hypothetical protein
VVIQSNSSWAVELDALFLTDISSTSTFIFFDNLRWVRVSTSGIVQARMGSVIIEQAITSGALHRYKIWQDFDSKTAGFSIDGVTVDTTGTTDFPELTLGAIGNNSAGGLPLDGYIANVKVWDGSTDSAATPTYSWAIDSDGTTGVELPDQGDIALTRTSLTSIDTAIFTLDETTNPDQWVSEDVLTVIPIEYLPLETDSVRPRYFTTLDETAAQYYALDTPIVLVGDFAIEIKALPTGNTLAFFGSASSFLRYSSSGIFQCMINSNYKSNLAYSNSLNTFNRFVLSRNGANVSVHENGELLATYDFVTDDFTIDNIGSRGTYGNHFNGIIADVKIWEGTDDTSVTPTYSWALNSYISSGKELRDIGTISLTRVNMTEDGSALFTYNEDDSIWVGPNILLNGEFDTDYAWSYGTSWDLSNGTATAVYAGGGAGLQQNVASSTGDHPKFLLDFDIEILTGIIGYKLRSDSYIDISESQHISTVAINDAANNFLAFTARASADAYVDNVELRKILEVPS